MSKVTTTLTTASLTGAFIICTFTVIAALDEFARLPFYYTLPLAAILVNSSVLLLLWRNKEKSNYFKPIYSRLRFSTRPFPNQPAYTTGNYRLNESDAASAKPGKSDAAHIQDVRTFSPPEVNAALGKIHSVAWGFPAEKRSVDSMIQGARFRHEVHQ